MKRYKHLWEKICTLENFELAIDNAFKGKSKYKEVKEIEKIGRTEYAQALLKEVEPERYTVSKYTVFHRFTGGKDRIIYKLPMKDRIVQHAIMNIIEPIFRETFIINTYSSIKGRGTHAQAKYIKKLIKDRSILYYLNLDIEKCYPSLDKNILKKKLAKKFKDKKLLHLLYLIVDSCDKGIPIGNYTSLYFNNLYFNDLDHYIKEKLRVAGYVRYCDNIIIFGRSKHELHIILKEILILLSELNVSLKYDYQIYNIDIGGVDSVGYIIRRGYIRVRKHTKNRFIRKICKMNLTNLSLKDINVLGSYWGIFIHADCRNLWFKYTKVKKFKHLNKNTLDKNLEADA